MLISAPEGSDLMDPASWAMTPPLAFDGAWLRGHGLPDGSAAGYLEGATLRTHRRPQWPVPLPGCGSKLALSSSRSNDWNTTAGGGGGCTAVSCFEGSIGRLNSPPQGTPHRGAAGHVLARVTLAGNAVEGADGHVHVLLRVPVSLPGGERDLNHACLLTWTPPAHLGRCLVCDLNYGQHRPSPVCNNTLHALCWSRVQKCIQSLSPAL